MYKRNYFSRYMKIFNCFRVHLKKTKPMKRRILFLLLLLPFYAAQAQRFLSIDTISANTFVSQLNQVLEIPVRVKAYDSLNQVINWQGVIDYYVLTDSMVATQQNPRLFYSTGNAVLVSTNGYNDTLQLDVLPQEMRLGGNVIIVWPASASPNVFPKDSAEVDVQVTGGSGIEGNDTHSLVQIYPNPAGETLVVQSATGWIKAELFDMKGKSIAVQYANEKANGEMDLRSVPSGAYVIRILLPNGSLLTRLVVKR